MKILLDGRPSMGGIERYTHGLIGQLRAALPAGDLLLFGRQDGAPGGPGTSPAHRGAVRAAAGDLKRVAVDQQILPRIARRAGVDLFHSPNYLAPRKMPVPTVVTCHDLWLLDHPETKKRGWAVRYETDVLRSGLQRAAHVITPSEAVARQVSERFELEPDRVSTIYPPLPEFPRETGDLVRVEPFFLAVGTLEPRKNLERLLDAHAIAFERTHIPLRLVGRYGWRQENLLRRLERAPDRVRWLGPVSDTELGSLYRRAAAVLQVSLDEGFSYPVAEALGFGAPLLLSDIPVHREIADGIAEFRPGTEVDALADGMLAVASWSASRREDVSGRAAGRLRHLQRRGEVDRVLRVYEKVLS